MRHLLEMAFMLCQTLSRRVTHYGVIEALSNSEANASWLLENLACSLLIVACG